MGLPHPLFLMACVLVPCALSQQVDLFGIAETCAANFVTQDYQDNWEDKYDDTSIYLNRLWNVPLASKLYIYLTSHALYKTNSFVRFDEAHFPKACLQSRRINGWGASNVTGFGQDHQYTLQLYPSGVQKLYNFILPYGPNGPSRGTASIILTDNDSFTVFEFCHDEGFRTFAVFARGALNSENNAAIRLHLKSIGFKERHFVDLDEDSNCIQLGTGEFVPTFPDNVPVPAPNQGTINIGFRSPNKWLIFPGGLSSYLPLPSFFWKKKK